MTSGWVNKDRIFLFWWTNKDSFHWLWRNCVVFGKNSFTNCLNSLRKKENLFYLFKITLLSYSKRSGTKRCRAQKQGAIIMINANENVGNYTLFFKLNTSVCLAGTGDNNNPFSRHRKNNLCIHTEQHIITFSQTLKKVCTLRSLC